LVVKAEVLAVAAGYHHKTSEKYLEKVQNLAAMVLEIVLFTQSKTVLSNKETQEEREDTQNS
jgi:hypothetical protein